MHIPQIVMQTGSQIEGRKRLRKTLLGTYSLILVDIVREAYNIEQPQMPNNLY